MKRRAEKFEDDGNAAAKSALNEFFGGGGGGGGGGGEGDGDGGVSKEDAFLRDFLLNEKWREDENKVNIVGGDVVPGESSEEEMEARFGSVLRFNVHTPKTFKALNFDLFHLCAPPCRL